MQQDKLKLKQKYDQLNNDRRAVEKSKAESIKIAHVQAQNEGLMVEEKIKFEEFKKTELDWIDGEKARIEKLYEENLEFQVN